MTARMPLERAGMLSPALIRDRIHRLVRSFSHGWDQSLCATAMFFPGDYPREPQRLPRALAAHVMAQAEDPANLDRWANPAYRLITVILIRSGLRVSSAAGLAWAGARWRVGGWWCAGWAGPGRPR